MQQKGEAAWVADMLGQPWQNAGDCEALDRIWRGAVDGGLVTVSGARARVSGDRPGDDESWVRLSVNATVLLLEDLCEDFPYLGAGVLYGLLRSYSRRCDLVDWDEIVDFTVGWSTSAEERAIAAEYGHDLRAFDRGLVDSGVGRVADTGILEESEGGFRLTPLGDLVVAGWLQFRQG